MGELINSFMPKIEASPQMNQLKLPKLKKTNGLKLPKLRKIDVSSQPTNEEKPNSLKLPKLKKISI
jgi:hypothetical protein